MQKKKHEIELNKLYESEVRHNKNVLNEQEKYEKRRSDNQEKSMKKNFYILMKNMMKNIID